MAGAAPAARDWAGLQQFPAPTQAALQGLFERLRADGKESLTVLVLGKSGVGKSSTVNSMLGERVCVVSAFQSETMRPVMCSRIKSGFTLSVVDTPGLVEAGSVNDQSLDLIRRFLLDKRVDAILYVDRLDNYRVDNLDRQVFRAIARAFGPKVWRIASIVLTHAQLSPPDGVSYSDFVAKRTAALQQAVRQETGLRKGDRQVPTVLVENSGRCATNSGGEKILPDGTVWLPQMVEAVVDAATSGRPPLVVDQKLIDGPDANRRGKIWIPLLLAVQFFLVLKPILKLIEKDVAAEHAKRPTWELRAERALQKEAARAAEERRAELAEEALEREAAEAAAEAEELYGEDDEEYEDDEED